MYQSHIINYKAELGRGRMLIIIMNRFLVRGTVDVKTISELIENVSPYAPEAIPTARRKIINKFKELGYNEQDIVFKQIKI